MVINIDIKPLSVNEAYQGKRFKTPKHKSYGKELMYKLPKIKLPEPPYKMTIEYGFSTKLADIDNPNKPFLDFLCKKYKFDDRDIYELHLFKKIVPKGKEYIKFTIE